MKRVATSAIVAVALVAVFATPALAYDETNSGKSCVDCHTTDPVDGSRQGPHGGYTTGTQKCRSCHAVHNADPNGTRLLPGASISQTCNTCHDGTSGTGVYGVLQARTGAPPAADHSIEATNLIPRGNPDGTAREADLSGRDLGDPAAPGTLTCTDCHSPHDAETVAPFIGDRDRSFTADVAGSPVTLESDPASQTPTNRLLKKRPVGGLATVTYYGADWCASCHQGRMDTAPYAHSTETETNTADYFHYGRVARVTGKDTTTTEIGPMGQSNFGYVMPDTNGSDPAVARTAEQTGHKAICQQCHEDARNVGDYSTTNPQDQGQIASSNLDGLDEGFRAYADGADPAASDPAGYANPRFTTFPHEGVNQDFVIESTSNDLCLNCHIP